VGGAAAPATAPAPSPAETRWQEQALEKFDKLIAVSERSVPVPEIEL
jgi:hypothetical protein